MPKKAASVCRSENHLRTTPIVHDGLDAAVLQACDWSDPGPVSWRIEAARAAWLEALLERLVAPNLKRLAEEAAGAVRWLRSEFQDPARRAAAASVRPELDEGASLLRPDRGMREQMELAGVESEAEASAQALRRARGERMEGQADDNTPTTPITVAAQPWPSTLPEQVRAVAQPLSASPLPLPLPAIEAAFKDKGPWKRSLPRILDTLEALGRARQEGGGGG